MNRFGVMVSALQACAAIEAALGREYQQAIIYTAFSAASLAIAWQ